MRTLTMTSILILLTFLLALPASADYRDRDNGRNNGRGNGRDRGWDNGWDSGDYIYDKLDEWIDYAESLDYDVVEARVESVNESRSILIELAPGEYEAYAEGGQDIADLDMIVYDDRGYELGSDFLVDNYPIVNFSIRDWQEVEFVLEVFEYDGWQERGEFCFVLARVPDYNDDWRGRDRDYDDRDRNPYRDRGDDDWYYNDDNYYDDRNRDDERYWDNWDEQGYDWDEYWNDWDEDSYFGRDRWDDDWSRTDRRDIVENKLEYLYDYAWSRNLDPIMDDVSEIDGTRTYEMTLDRGYYVLMASGGPLIDDLDLHVYWRDGWDVAEDVNTDANPAVWFYVPDRTSVQIEVEVWSFNGNYWDDYFCILLCED
jgi:hypothetical protein